MKLRAKKRRKIQGGVLYEDGRPCAWCGKRMDMEEHMRWPNWVCDECAPVAYPHLLGGRHEEGE